MSPRMCEGWVTSVGQKEGRPASLARMIKSNVKLNKVVLPAAAQFAARLTSFQLDLRMPVVGVLVYMCSCTLVLCVFQPAC